MVPTSHGVTRAGDALLPISAGQTTLISVLAFIPTSSWMFWGTAHAVPTSEWGREVPVATQRSSGLGAPSDHPVPIPKGAAAHGVPAVIITGDAQGWPQLSANTASGQEKPQKK